jgi:hypothetical protein
MKKAVFIAAVMAIAAFAQNDLDSLRAEIERLNAQLEIQRLNAELQRRQQMQAIEVEAYNHEEENGVTMREALRNLRRAIAENINAGAENMRGGGEEEIIEIEIDTSDETSSAFRKMVLDNREWTRNNFIGMGGGPVVGVMYLNTRPIKNYLRDLQAIPDRADWENPLSNSNLSNSFSNREPAFVIGGFGLGNFGNGAIAGGGGYAILTSFASYVKDTVYTATVAGGYGGFIFGGGWSNRKNSLSITTLIGGGGLAVDVGKRHITNAFDRNDDWWELGNKNSVLTEGSGFFALEGQIAYTHSFIRWFHIGVEGAALLMHSRNGFEWTSGYTTVNPSVKLRLVFGSI